MPIYSISQAKQHLGEIVDRAIKGERVMIIRKSQLLTLNPLDIPESVPMRPPGYFDDCYDARTLAPPEVRGQS